MQKTSNPLHEIPNADFKSVCNGLNCEQRRILDPALNAAQESSVKVGFGCESFLRQLSLQPHFPNPLPELFRNVMPHLPKILLGHNRRGCRLYPTTGLTVAVRSQQNPARLSCSAKPETMAAVR